MRLIRYFEWRGCVASDELADVCIDRVMKKIGDGEAIQNVNAYSATIAQFVYRESLRSTASRTDSIEEESFVEIAAEETEQEDSRLSCLDRCLDEFSSEDRRLIVNYYDTDERTMIASRRRLAETLAMTMNTLRIKVCRLKARLETCTKDCCRESA